jgi:RHS repeat-associated protein
MPLSGQRGGGASGRAVGDGSSAPPAITLPKGGGAIRGMGEKFSANPATGTGSLSVPIYTSPGRSGFGPELSLSYDSGTGNGPFGFGWSLSVPSITRKTDRGLPEYRDAEESDVYLLSGAEDMVPVLQPDGSRFEDTTTAPGYTIHRYRPRIEGLFARIERWTRQSDDDVHWRSISRDNILTLYGKDQNSRIADPADPRRIFTWLLCETRDDKGNAILYEYKPEDGAGVDLTRAHERNRGDRDDPRRKANRYLKRLRYGNRVPLLDDAGQRPRFLTGPQIQNAGWMFEVVFDYGEHDAHLPKPDDAGDWTYRDDPFSSYRAGFEVRTCRLCRRVLVSHHFEHEAGIGDDCLVRSTDFSYSHEQDPDSARNPVYTFLLAATQRGYKRHNGGYLKRSLPPVEFEYSQPVVQDVVQDVDAESLENLPMGLDGAAYQWTDLHGEGIPGILTEQGGAWFYKRNLSPISERPVELAPMELVASKPNLPLAGGQAQFMDLAGDGQPDLVVLDGPMPGLYEHDGDEGWQPFRPFISRLNRATRDPNLKFVDLDGDGRADVLITEDGAFVWHRSLAEEGFGPAQRVHQVLDEEKGPRLVLADGAQSIYLADISGDGLTDLVRIRSGEICYWPNLGYGRFGAKVTMDHAPRFDQPDQFNHNRIRLADIDGTGTTDIIYLHRDGVRLYFNQSGNSWSAAQGLRVFPRVDGLAAITPTDLLGNGTACLVWSSPLPGDSGRQMRYVDLMGGQKPHLLVKTVNNLGAETRVQYATSTKFYLQDKHDGNPWITKVPFPVHVVERVEIYDRISRNRFVTRYAYHHGYFDGIEREFRGFGMVEQWDTETFAALGASDDFPTGDNNDPAFHVPPVYTKTWFHTGIYVGRDQTSDFFAGLIDAHDRGEYYREPGLTDAQARALLLPDTILPPGLTLEEEREACRALKGSMLRQEVYALDGTPRAEHPYTVTEQNFTIRHLQPHDGNRHAVFFTHAREAISYNYERNPADPRVSHGLMLEVDPYGNVLKGASIGYGRRHPDPTLPLQADRDRQTQTLITYTENRFTNPIDDPAVHPDDYRTPLPCETRTYELTGYTPTGTAGRFQRADFVRPADNGLEHSFDGEIHYEEAPTDGKERRLIEQLRTLYRPDDLGVAQNDPLVLLPLGTVQTLALAGESYKLAFTPGLLAQVFQRGGQPLLPDPADVLGGQGADRGGYLPSQQPKADGRFPDTDPDDHWWIPAGRVFLSPGTSDTPAQELAHAHRHFFLPHRHRDPFHTSAISTESFVDYDAYDLLMLENRDPLGNRVTVGERLPNGAIDPAEPGNDYRVLQPWRVMDPNRNRTQVAFDALGMVVGTAVTGKPEQNVGDSLDGFEADLTEAVTLDHLTNPLTDPHAILGRATTRLVYDLFAYQRTKDQPDPQPAAVYTLARETHDADLEAGQQTKIQHRFSYSDGFGREVQQKIQAEPEKIGGVVGPLRWVGSGWTIFNNKGKPVRQYEPFFSELPPEDGHRFEFGVQVGVSPLLFYDPVERVVATVHPNHTYEKVVFDPWHQTIWDVSDTVLLDPRTDDDIKGFTKDYFAVLTPGSWQTWHSQRRGGALGSQEQAAANKAAAHAGTPTTAHFDTLGRPLLTVARNRFERGGATVDETYATRVELDIEGNRRVVRDALGRVVMRYDYHMAGPGENEESSADNLIHQSSMEAGERWMLGDVAGNPIRAWDSRRFLRRMSYDELRRPTGLYVTDSGVERLAERTVYGESQGDGANHRTRVYRVFDGAGIVTNKDYDFKGNLRESRRDLLPNYKQAVDWQQNPAANDGAFTSRTTFDALNRPLTLTTPDESVYHATFNEANLLDKVDVNLRGAVATTPFVTNIDYDAKGQRKRIEYGNSVFAEYAYDKDTFRLVHLKTTRPTFPAARRVVQNLRHTYDPVGNVTHIEDDADIQNVVFFRNRRVEPSADYVYDAIYRLTRATGREHLGQTAGGQLRPPTPASPTDVPRVGLAHPGDGNALGRFTETYDYDEVGNIARVIHTASSGGWTRRYAYDEPSLIEQTKTNNRLSTSTVRNQTVRYSHDAHGNMIRMPHLSLMRWDHEDQLRATSKQVVGNGGTPETTYYVYDSAGQRVRKVTERQAAPGERPTRKEERIYLGGYEVYREYGNNGATVTLERESLHVMDDRQRIALVETQTIANGNRVSAPAPLQRYQLGNHLSSATLELDDHAQIISYEEYTPYGSTSYQAVRSQTEAPKRYRYTGKERDKESGLCYHGARYYIPWLGRWTTTDPAGLVDGDNLYRYSTNNPIKFTDTSGTQSTGEFRLPVANPVTDTEAHSAYFDLLLPGLLGRGLEAADLRSHWALRATEFFGSGLLLYGPTVLSHELGGHVGAAQRFGFSSSVASFYWFGGSATWSGTATPQQSLVISAAGSNQQMLNARTTYSRVARTGEFNPQDAWAYFLGQAGLGAYALRTLSLSSPPPQDDINAYVTGSRSWSTGGLAAAGVVTALPSLVALGVTGYRFIASDQRRLQIPSLDIGGARLTFPHLQTLLTSNGPVLGGRTVLKPGGNWPDFEFSLDVRPSSNFALAVGARAHGIRIPGVPRLQVSPYLRTTFANPVGIYGGIDVSVDIFRWLAVSGSIGGRTNDLLGETEGRTGGLEAGGGAILRF